MSAGLLRVLGGEVAELPIVATRRDTQGLVSLNLLSLFILFFLFFWRYMVKCKKPRDLSAY